MRFEDLGSVGVIARKLQNKLGGRDEKEYAQEPLAYGRYYEHQSPQPHTQQHHPHAHYGSQSTPDLGYMGHPHRPHPPQYQQQYLYPQHPHAHQQASPRPIPSPRPMEPNPYMNNTPQPHPGSYSSPSPRPSSYQQSSGATRLPPGTYIDTKTGKIQTNMFPPDYEGPLLQR